MSRNPTNSRDWRSLSQAEPALGGTRWSGAPGLASDLNSMTHWPCEARFSPLPLGAGVVPSTSQGGGVGSARWHVANMLGTVPGTWKHSAKAKGKASATFKVAQVVGGGAMHNITIAERECVLVCADGLGHNQGRSQRSADPFLPRC